MKLMEIDVSHLVCSDDLVRSGSSKQFEERLRASIEEIGLAEPLKVAPLPTGSYLVVDGTMRLRAILAIREHDPSLFPTVPVYITDYDRRFEIRFQSDIYQDLLPSQLAVLVEHLHQAERVRKADIARYIGVSPATLRNYTGLWRLLQRGGLFSKIVELMDVGVIPSSNPFAWLRLTDSGVEHALVNNFTDGLDADAWIDNTVVAVRQGRSLRFTTEFVETATDDLAPHFYREDQELRTVKRDLGSRKGQRGAAATGARRQDHRRLVRHLDLVSDESPDLVLRTAARALKTYFE